MAKPHWYICIYIYTYIYRERDRERFMCIYIHIHIMSVSLNAPGTQKTFVLLGKGLVLKGSPSNTDIILAPLLHWYWRAIYTYTHMYTCNYTVCASFPHFSTNHGNQDANSHLPLTSFLQRLGANVEAHAAPAMRRQLDIEWPSWVSNPQKRGTVDGSEIRQTSWGW